MHKHSRRQFLNAIGLAAGANLSASRFARPSLWAAPPATSATPRREIVDVSALVKETQVKHQTPGMVGAIVDLKGIHSHGASGLRKAGSAEPFLAGDLIHLGSCTKALTATLVGHLIDKKKLRFESTMRDVFPKLAPKMNADMAKVTVTQLLSHTVGVPADLDWWSFDRTGKPLTAQRLLVVQKVLTSAPEQPPGSKYVYSNTGYDLLGAIIEAKSRTSWEDYMTAQLFQPLGMKSAGFGPPGSKGKIDQPWGHLPKSGSLEPQQHDNPPVMGPAGRVHCTIDDWAKYIRFCLRMEKENSKILSQATQKQLLTPAPHSEYSGGWIITERDWAGGRTLTHSGSNTLWYCTAWLAPLKGFAVLTATNLGGDDAALACNELATALIGTATSAKPAA